MKYNKTSSDIINDLLWYTSVLKEMIEDIDDKKKYFVNGKLPEILYILPVNFDYLVNANMIFNKEKEVQRQEIIKYFNDNNINNIYFNDIALFSDGIHLNYEGHQTLANKVFEEIKDE